MSVAYLDQSLPGFSPYFWVWSLDRSVLIQSPDVGEQSCCTEMAQRAHPGT